MVKPGSHIHLIGICGTAMASLAGLFKDRGYKITGSDQNPYPPMSTQLEKLGIQIQIGYRAENLNPRPDFVIVGNVVGSNNPEAQELVRLGIPYTSLAKAIGENIIEQRESIVISGTHGKTTTTSLMAWVAEVCGLEPGFMIGGIPKNFSKSFQNPSKNYFIIEGDEYDTAYFDKVPKFIHYRPRHVILTSIEFDHADIYADLEAVKAAFKELLKLIPDNGTLIYSAADKNIMELLKCCHCHKKIGYGFDSLADVQAKVVNQSEEWTEFSVSKGGKLLGVFKMQLGGDYNVLNAAAVVALSDSLNLPMEKVKEALKSFLGVKRRQEILGEPNGILIIEDFAHHPTAVRETLLGIVKKYPKRKVFAVFEPRSATSRRRIFQKDYVQAFLPAQEILLAKAFDQSKLQTEDRFSSEELAQELRDLGKSATCFENVDSIVTELKEKSQPGDLILIMSNGGFDGIYQKLLLKMAAN